MAPVSKWHGRCEAVAAIEDGCAETRQEVRG
jgi:hypothetical protein